MAGRSTTNATISSRSFHAELEPIDSALKQAPRTRSAERVNNLAKSAKSSLRKKKSSGTLPAAPPLLPEDLPPPGYECLSPILPRAKVAFPGIFSSDEDEPIGCTFPTHFLSESDGDGPYITQKFTTKTTTTWSYASLDQDHNAPFDRRRTTSHASTIFPSPKSAPSSTLFPSEHGSRPYRTATKAKSSSNLRDRFGLPSYTTTPVDKLPSLRLPTMSRASPLPPRVVVPAPSKYVSPMVNAFLAMFISTIACGAISVVLLGSFALTAFDDAGKRFSYLCDNLSKVQATIGGVRSGVERVMEGASGALGLVSWAAGSGKGLRRSFDIKGKGVAGAGPDPARSRWRNFGRSVGAGVQPRKRPMSPQSRRSSNLNPATKPGSRLNPRSNDSVNFDNDHSWDSEEDPYLVPPSTPRDSRSPSALNSDNDEPSSPRRADSPSALPPRPPLMLLIPSIFALIFLTVWKLLTNWLSVPKSSKV